MGTIVDTSKVIFVDYFDISILFKELEV